MKDVRGESRLYKQSNRVRTIMETTLAILTVFFLVNSSNSFADPARQPTDLLLPDGSSFAGKAINQDGSLAVSPAAAYGRLDQVLYVTV